MLLRHIENVEERTEQLLHRLAASIHHRDACLQEVRHAVRSDADITAALEEVSQVELRTMPQAVSKCEALARTVSVNAAVAESSSKRVRRLDALLQRVQTTMSLVDAMSAMEEDALAVPHVLEDGDLKKAVQLLRSYEAAQGVLTTAAAATSSSPSSTDASAATTAMTASGALNPAETRRAMQQARATVQARLLTSIDAAVKVNDKLTIMTLTRLLAQLGESATAARLYSDWIANHTIAGLAKLIDAEMRKMDDPATVAMTHLALVSQGLDNVAAAFELDEGFVGDAFGAEGPLTLLAELHSRATARCVPVLSDFIERRKGVLAQLETAAAAGERHSSPGRSPRGDRNGRANGGEGALPVPNAALRNSTEANRSGSPSAAVSNAGLVVASTRRADQILEEISHMVSCGYIYLNFIQRKQSEYESEITNASTTAAAAGSATSTAAAHTARGGSDSLWKTRDNALLNAMQDILAFYVPLQNSYFTIAYEQALELQTRAIAEAAVTAAAAAVRTNPGTARGGGASSSAAGAAGGQNGGRAAGSSSPLPASAATFMNGLQNLYTVAASSADELLGGSGGLRADGYTHHGGAQASEAELASFWYFTHDGQVTLADDVFFFLRMALHRAINTGSTQICSAVFMSAMDVVQSRLLPEIARHVRVVSRGGGGGARKRTGDVGGADRGRFLAPEELHWAGAVQQTAIYLQRMADELQQLSATAFAGSARDVVRFRELSSEMREVGRNLQSRQIPQWLDKFAELCCDSVLPPHLDRFASISYDMKEEVYYHYELNDVWVQACLVDLGAGLQYLHEHLSEGKLFDRLLVSMAKLSAKASGEVLLRKRFSLFGALQMDKDVRALRGFFTERANNDLAPIRDAFAALNLMTTLLLSDKPTDALEEMANTALTAEEKKQVLLSRVEFKKEAVMALPF